MGGGWHEEALVGGSEREAAGRLHKEEFVSGWRAVSFLQLLATVEGVAVAWGDNKHGQCSLGDDATMQVPSLSTF